MTAPGTLRIVYGRGGVNRYAVLEYVEIVERRPDGKRTYEWIVRGVCDTELTADRLVTSIKERRERDAEKNSPGIVVRRSPQKIFSRRSEMSEQEKPKEGSYRIVFNRGYREKYSVEHYSKFHPFGWVPWREFDTEPAARKFIAEAKAEEQKRARLFYPGEVIEVIEP